MKVLVVESPAKAKTINKYLGSGYQVVASFGHVRDLPAKDGSVDPDNNFHMLWELDGRGAKQIAEIAKGRQGCRKAHSGDRPDREGEAISWHIQQALTEKRALKDVPVERVTFNAITKDAVQKALAEPRQVDQALVDAYLARRALDYLVGFRLSPVLWRKLPGAKSAGRVQSVALKLVADREREIEAFPGARILVDRGQARDAGFAPSSRRGLSEPMAGRSRGSMSARRTRLQPSARRWKTADFSVASSRRSPPGVTLPRPS